MLVNYNLVIAWDERISLPIDLIPVSCDKSKVGDKRSICKEFWYWRRWMFISSYEI